MSDFTLHPQLAADTFLVGDLTVCRVLLMNNAHFPWLILVPRRNGIRELFELSSTDYATTMQEIKTVAEQFGKQAGAHKMNVAALGNMVPQLHIHIIARFTTDIAWPQPVWNAPHKAVSYDIKTRDGLLEKTRKTLGF